MRNVGGELRREEKRVNGRMKWGKERIETWKEKVGKIHKTKAL